MQPPTAPLPEARASWPACATARAHRELLSRSFTAECRQPVREGPSCCDDDDVLLTR